MLGACHVVEFPRLLTALTVLAQTATVAWWPNPRTGDGRYRLQTEAEFAKCL